MRDISCNLYYLTISFILEKQKRLNEKWKEKKNFADRTAQELIPS